MHHLKTVEWKLMIRLLIMKISLIFAMPMYNLIECSDSYSDLWGFKRNDVVNNADMTNDNNAPSFKYKGSIIDNTETDRTKKWSKNICTTKIY